MKRSVAILICSFLIAVLIQPSAPTFAQQTGTLTPISPIGTTSYGNNPAISADGRFIAFVGGDNTIVGDANNYQDIFVYDHELNTISLVSRPSIGNQSDGGNSFYPSMSKNGRYISYESNAYNLVETGYNGYRQIYVYDQQTGENTLISVSSSGASGNRNSFASAISGDGRYVAFTSEATNLVANDTNNSRDVFVHDRQTGQTTIVSVTSAGELRSGNAETVVDISEDGRYVAFITSAQLADVSGLQIYVRDRQAMQTERISRRYTDGGAVNGMTASYTDEVSISDDGRYVAFVSNGTNFVPNDYNTGADGFLYDRQLAETSLITPYNTYNEAAYINSVAISGNAEYVVFSSQYQFVPEDTNGYKIDIFRYHIPTQTMALISVKADGEQGIDNSHSPIMSDDGRWVAFVSIADNFVTGNFDKPHLLLKDTTLLNPIPTAPTLLTPTTGATSADPQMTVTWDSVANATDYQVQLATDAQFTKIQYDQTVATTNATLPIIPNAYYWRVRGKNGAIFGEWSEVRTFSRTFTSIPVLDLPADLTTTNQQSISFTWGAMPDVLAYEFQLASDNGFATIIKTGIATSPTITQTISTQGTYYWRVRAKNGDYASDWSTPFSLTITQLPAPVLLTPVHFGLITTQDPVEFSWEAVPNATHYQIYISQDPTFEFVWYQDDFVFGTTFTQAFYQSGTYYWKVIPYQDNLGGVVSALNQFNVDYLPTPILTSPSTSITSYSNNVTFTWEPVVGATGYYVHIDNDPNPYSSIIYDAETTSYTHTFQSQGTFYWRVSAYSDTAASDESETRIITIGIATPNLTAPVHQSTTTNNVITFTWDAVAGAPEYEIQIDSNASGYHPTIIQTVTTNSYTFTAIEGATYTWKVRAKGTGFNISNWSATRQVTLDTSALPVVTTLISPVHQSTITNWDVTFTWQPVDGVTEYEFHLSNSTYYGNSLLTQVTTNTSITFTIPQNLNYYWRVRTKVGDVRGAWTSASFTMDLYNKPVNLQPLHNTVLEVPTNTDVTFTWDAVAHVTGYQIQISPDRNFNGTTVDTVITSNTYTHNLHSAEWYWRVRGLDYHTGYWSDVQRFTVAFLATPTLTAPANNTTFSVTNTAIRTQTYQWNAVAGATSYNIQISTRADFDLSDYIIISTNVSSTSYTYQASAATYYWRVRANKSGGFSAWSAPFAITFNAVPPPTLISPDGDAFTDKQMTFSWNAVPNATQYEIRTYTLPYYGSLSTWTTTNTSYDGSVITTGSYAWNVRSQAGGVYGEWSDYKFFTVGQLLAPTLITPIDRDFEDITPTRTLSWNPVAGATAYMLQFKANSSNFYSMDDINMGLDTSYNATGLSLDNYYYWRVIPMSGVIRGTPSETRVFRVKPLFTPNINTPLNMAIIAGNDVTFSWSSVADATDYQFQIGTSIAFTTLIHDTILADTSLNIVLEEGNVYFWRVRARNANGALSEWSQGRQFTPNPLLAPTIITPADMTTSISPSVNFSWDAVAEATAYQIQISTNAEFAPTITDQTIGTLSYAHIFTSANTYYWRVRAIKGAGNGYWTTTHQLIIESPAIPNLTAPDDMMTSLYPDVAFTWDIVPNATSYQIQISTNSIFNPTVDDQIIPTNSHAYTAPLGTYYWRVRSRVDDLNGEWSAVRHFSISPMPAPINTLPAHMTTTYDPLINFSWDAVIEATDYQLQISTDGGFWTIIYDQTITTTTHSYTLPEVDSYYWRVRGKNATLTGLWSTPSRLTLSLPAPNLVAPADIFTTNASELTFSWDSVAGATDYRIQISFDNTFAYVMYDQTTAITSHTQAFIYPYIYYWRVQGLNGDWSAIRQFTIELPTVNLIAPADMMTTSNPTITFSWEAVAGATDYQIEITITNPFGPVIYSQTVTNPTHTQFVADAGTYYWKVRARNNTLLGEWSLARQFTTEPFPPVTLIAPSDQANISDPTIPFSWDAMAGATSYQIQISTDITFATVTYDQTVTNPTHTQFIGTNAIHYWRVRAKLDATNGNWSVTRQFTTQTPPNLIAPVDMSSTVENSITFSWDMLPNATEYQIQISTDSGFGTFTANQTQTETSYTHTFTESGIYYWRVLGRNGALDSAWATYQFTLQKLPAPTLLTPIDGYINTETSVLHAWTPIAGATSYTMQIADNPNFLGETTFINHITYEWNLNIVGLDVAYWRVLAQKGAIRGEWSETRQVIKQALIPTQQEANEQDLFNAMQANLTDSFQFAIMDVEPTGILTTLQFDDGAVVSVMVTMSVNNGLITIMLDNIQGATTQAQLDTLYADVPVMMMNMLNDMLPDDYVSIESLTLTDTDMVITVIAP
jgi:hypothetical protein